MKVEWTEDLSVGVNIIDQQHQEYFRRVNNLLEAIEQGRAKEQLMDLLGFVGNYVEFHFNTEEAYMARKIYPGYEAHASQHAIFKNQFSVLSNEFEIAGASNSLTQRLQSLLVNWLVVHIQKVDTVLGAFLKNNL